MDQEMYGKIEPGSTKSSRVHLLTLTPCLSFLASAITVSRLQTHEEISKHTMPHKDTDTLHLALNPHLCN